ncbi:T9SS type A sorting domain-containing protein [Fluviicola chungangensis]|uniref:T9SS type A sorting domain-containing protein n=1 Tax=Fluviicola chungangensis TaxID=2597671 RepID=A0A556N252_9FLAO|nr:T9SS type A sorting domain-containing protein [Fluviicola chungangensis]TSJ46272.1 T9SS type A sorting domain-containing protein [Fluviicola chungangensis]
MKPFKSILAIFYLLTTISLAQPGTNDPSFNASDNGFYGNSNGLSTVCYSSLIQADGKILVGGANSHPVLHYNGFTHYGITRINTDGSIDLSFNLGTGFNSWTNAIALQSDGKIIAGGPFTTCNGVTRNGIARLNTDGSLDTTFNPGMGFPFGSSIGSIAVQTDGKIIVAGNFNSFNGFSRSRIVRLNTDGSIDLSYIIGTGFTGLSNSGVSSIKLQPDGKLIAVGSFSGYNGTTRLGIARLTTNGSLDATFNPGSGFNGTVWDLDIQTDGKIVAVGGFTSFYGQSSSRIARLNSNGTIDASFVIGSGFNTGYCTAVKIKNDGTIMVGGTHYSYNGTLCAYLVRINSNGSVEPVFSSNLGAALNSQVEDISIQNDGKIIVLGSFSSYNLTLTGSMLRLNVDGNLDETFNQGSGFNEFAGSMGFQADGKQVIGGNFSKYNGIIQNKITRIYSNGDIDTTFDIGEGFNNTVSTIRIQDDDKILVAGDFSLYNGLSRLKIARLNPDGSLDSTFDPGSGFNNYVRNLCVQGDGKILAGGTFTSFNGNTQNYFIRLNADGSQDQTFIWNSNNPVYSSIIQPDGKIVVVGDFTYCNGNSVNKITRLNTNGGIDLTFNSGNGPNYSIYTSAIQADGKILVGGNFTTFNGLPKNRLVRLNSNGSLDATFNTGSGLNGDVKTIIVQDDGKIIIGGSFTSYNGISRNRIVRLNSDGSLDGTFISGTGFDDEVLSLLLQADQKIFVGGRFSNYNGNPRNRLTRLLNCYPSTSSITASACNNYTLNGQNYTSSGIYTQTLINSQGCDSIITLNLSIQHTNDTLFVSTCDVYNWYGQAYSTSGFYSHQFTNMYGCDSIITLSLIVSNPSSSTINTVECNSYLFNGNQYFFSGQYLDTISNSAGCDSIITLNLTILNSTSSSQSQTYCGPFTWSVNNQTYMASGQYIDTIPNAVGCDSIITLDLTILNSSSNTETQTACGSFTWPINGQTYAASGQYVDTIPNAAGCDSIITLDLTIIPALPLVIESSFSLPSDANTCIGEAAIDLSGNAPFELDFDSGSQIITSNGYSLVAGLCPGTHDLHVTDNCGDTLSTTIVIPVDSNFVFNNPFIDSLAQDSLGVTMTNCDIYYAGIDTAYIDSIWANGNTVNVIWNIVDSNGSNFDTTSYVLNNGNGVYWLQLSVFCPNKSLGEYFTVTEAIYFNNGNVSTAGLTNNGKDLFELYPNPTNDQVHISFSGSDAELTVYDVQGKVVLKEKIQNQGVVSLQHMERGVYLFDFNNSQGHSVQRMVKQ